MATSYQEAVEKTIIASEQLNQIVNGTATAEVIAEDGSKIPSIRKALVDNFYFKDPLPWQQGQTETVFNQLRKFTDGTLWYAPTATTSNIVAMGSSPVGDPLWIVYSLDAIPKLTPQIREALRRSYTEAGYNLVAGSFEEGGVLTSPTDVLLQESSGKSYSGTAGVVTAGTDPLSGSRFTDRSGELTKAQFVGYESSTVGQVLGTLIHAGAKGVKYGTGFDNTAVLQSIIDNYGKSGRAYTVQFESGIVCHGPLDFKGTKNLTFRGASNQYGYDTNPSFGANGTEFRCISSCAIFFKFSEENGTVSGEAWNGKVIDAVVNGNSLADVGISLNGCNSIFGTAVTGCLKDGVVRGNYTNQSIIVQCCLTRNLGNGLRDTGAAYTISSLDRTNIRQNNGYGIVIENGSYTRYSNSVVESNYTGGIKIFKKSIAGVCQSILFDNCHVEGNGRLPQSHPNYEGNYQLEIGGVSTTPLTFGSSPVLVYFKHCLWSITGEPISGGTSRNFFKFGSSNGVFFDNENLYTDGDVVAGTAIDTTYAGPVNLSMGSIGYIDWTPIRNIVGSNFFESSYRLLGGATTRGGEVGTGRRYYSRGRTTVYEVDITTANIPSAGGSYTVNVGGLMPRAPIFGDGSIVGLALAHYATTGTIAGSLTLTAHKATAPTSGQVNFTGCDITIPVVSTNLVKADFSVGVHNIGFSNQTWLGATLSASADFIKSANSVVKVMIIVEQ